MKYTSDVLEKLVSKVKCKPGWKFQLECDDRGNGLVISVRQELENNNDKWLTVYHYFPVPVANYNDGVVGFLSYVVKLEIMNLENFL